MLNGAVVSVRNQGTRNAGNLEINSNSIFLDKLGSMTAATQSGEGGNININSEESLIMRNGSFINAESLGTGNGGNLMINSPVIAGFENSDIIANAFQGMGGNINITTQGIFGLKFRDELSEESDISASSQFGISGKVKINNVTIDPSSGLVELPVELSDSSQQIATGCSSQSNNTFVATGKGGIVQNPIQYVDTNLTWSDIRDLSTLSNNKNIDEISETSNKPAIVEATGFVRNSSGDIELVAMKDKSFINNPKADCSGIARNITVLKQE